MPEDEDLTQQENSLKWVSHWASQLYYVIGTWRAKQARKEYLGWTAQTLADLHLTQEEAEMLRSRVPALAAKRVRRK